MNRGRNYIGGNKFRRKDYEAVKKMDRQQFERFCRALYEEGQQSVEKVTKGIDLQDVKEAVLSVKGIGQKRAEEILEALERKFKEKEGKCSE